MDRLPRRPGRGPVDVKRAVNVLARGQPVPTRLPTKPHPALPGEFYLIADRPFALRPAWDDMMAAWQAFSAVAGQTVLGRHYPAGPRRPPLPLGGVGAVPAIPVDALVVLAGAFGALRSGDMLAPWRVLIDELLAAGHGCVLLTVCPLRQPPCPALPFGSVGGAGGAGGASGGGAGIIGGGFVPMLAAGAGAVAAIAPHPARR